MTAHAQPLEISQAQTVLLGLGLPRAQHNERSALCLLALLDLSPGKNWAQASNPLIGITPMMEWMRTHYQKEYAPNTRETVRRQTLHQFVAAGLALYNPDDLARPVNSPKAVYQIAPGQHIALSPGGHSELIRAIVEEFAPRFAPGSTLLYAGDTADKWCYFNPEGLAALGVVVDAHGKMPDVVLHFGAKNWLLLVESVISHGPVDGKRHAELTRLFAGAKAGLVYVTAFPTRALMSRYVADIAWETEVWVADAPSHLIHFNGTRFLGPYVPPKA